MTDYYSAVIEPIRSFVESGGTPDRDIAMKLATMGITNVDNILNMIIGQVRIKELKDIINTTYKLDFATNKFDHVIDDYSYDEIISTVQISDSCLLFNTVHPLTLVEYIKKNDHNRYLFIQLGFSCETFDAAHQTVLVLDNYTQKAYLIDPNGSSTYFNRVYTEMLKTKLRADFFISHKSKEIKTDKVDQKELVEQQINELFAKVYDDIFEKSDFNELVKQNVINDTKEGLTKYLYGDLQTLMTIGDKAHLSIDQVLSKLIDKYYKNKEDPKFTKLYNDLFENSPYSEMVKQKIIKDTKEDLTKYLTSNNSEPIIMFASSINKDFNQIVAQLVNRYSENNGSNSTDKDNKNKKESKNINKSFFELFDKIFNTDHFYDMIEEKAITDTEENLLDYLNQTQSEQIVTLASCINEDYDQIICKMLEQYYKEKELRKMVVPINTYIDDMMGKYFKYLEQFGLSYSYITSYEWNPEDIVLNKNYKTKYLEGGNCVILTIMLIHYLHLTQYSPTEVMNIFGKLTDQQRASIIENYSSSIYNLIK